MLSWDALLCRRQGTRLPGRMWVFLAWKNGNGTTNLHLMDDIAEALDGMPMPIRPLTFHVVQPVAWIAATLKKVAVRSAFHAGRARGVGEGWG